MKKIIEKIKEYEKKGISDIQMIALVSDTSSEVIFYGIIDGVKYQSNNMVEEGKVDSDVVDHSTKRLLQQFVRIKNSILLK